MIIDGSRLLQNSKVKLTNFVIEFTRYINL